MGNGIQNEAAKAGQNAAGPIFFGANFEIEVVPVHTRFEAVSWFVIDRTDVDEFDMPPVIGQFAEKADAIHRAVDLASGFHVSILED